MASTTREKRDIKYRNCPCGETAHHYVRIARPGPWAGWVYACRNCRRERVIQSRFEREMQAEHRVRSVATSFAYAMAGVSP
jgi:hypothetical protein